MTRGDESLTFTLPRNIFYDSELRGMLTEFSATGAEQARIAKGMLFFVEHSLKASVFADQAARSARSRRRLRQKSVATRKRLLPHGNCWYHRVLEFSWRQEKLAENAEQIGNLGKDGNRR
jgi:hypothetical protein